MSKRQKKSRQARFSKSMLPLKCKIKMRVRVRLDVLSVKTGWLPAILCIENCNVTDTPVLAGTDETAENMMLEAAE